MKTLRLCPVLWRIFDEENRAIEIDQAKQLIEDKQATSIDKYFLELMKVNYELKFVQDKHRGW